WPATALQIWIPGTHWPPSQWSFIVQGSCNTQGVSASATVSGGHVPLMPLQVSARSQTLSRAGRHTYPTGLNVHEPGSQHGGKSPVLGSFSHCSGDSSIPLPHTGGGRGGGAASPTTVSIMLLMVRLQSSSAV